MSLVLRLAGVLTALFLCAGCGRRSESPAKIRLALDWYPEPEHGGYFQALAKGCYANAGLDVDLLSGTPRGWGRSRLRLVVVRPDLGACEQACRSSH